MKRFGALAAILLVAAPFVRPQTVAIKLNGDMVRASGGDFSSGLLGMTNYLRDQYTGFSGGFAAPQSAPGVSGEIMVFIGKTIGLGLGIGYFRLSKSGTAAYEADFVSAEESLTPRLDVLPLTLNLHYFVPLSGKFRLDLSAGIGAYLATLDWDFRTDISLALPEDAGRVFRGSDDFVFRSGRAFGYGLQAGAGLEYELFPGFSVTIHTAGRYASVGGFKGSWTEEASGDFWDFSDSGTDAYLWAYDWTVRGSTYAQLLAQKESPSGTTAANVRKAKWNLSGYSASAGIKIGFGRRS